MPLPWFRMWNEFATDPKVQSMPVAWQRHLVMIFCFHSADTLKTFDQEVLASIFGVSQKELAEIKSCFMKRGFITKDWTPKNWSKRQNLSDSSASRTRKYRERLRAAKLDCDGGVTVTTPSQPVTDTLRHADVTRQELELELEPRCARPRRCAPGDDDDDDFNEKTACHAAAIAYAPACEAGVTESTQNRPADDDSKSILEENLDSDPSLACLDVLVEEIEQTWLGAGWGSLPYDFAKSFLPSSIVYGFRQAMTLAWKGEKMTVSRIKGLIAYAQKHKLVPKDEVKTVDSKPVPVHANGRPKSEKQIWREEMAAARRALDAKIKAEDERDGPPKFFE